MHEGRMWLVVGREVLVMMEEERFKVIRKKIDRSDRFLDLRGSQLATGVGQMERGSCCQLQHQIRPGGRKLVCMMLVSPLEGGDQSGGNSVMLGC